MAVTNNIQASEVWRRAFVVVVVVVIKSSGQTTWARGKSWQRDEDDEGEQRSGVGVLLGVRDPTINMRWRGEGGMPGRCRRRDSVIGTIDGYPCQGSLRHRPPIPTSDDVGGASKSNDSWGKNEQTRDNEHPSIRRRNIGRSQRCVSVQGAALAKDVSGSSKLYATPRAASIPSGWTSADTSYTCWDQRRSCLMP